jgi:hypothetical protein
MNLSNKLLLFVFKAASVADKFVGRDKPPEAKSNDKAFTFNTINPTSGRNLPYSPAGVDPAVVDEAEIGGLA